MVQGFDETARIARGAFRDPRNPLVRYARRYAASVSGAVMSENAIEGTDE
jgi:hypothetical protein